MDPEPEAQADQELLADVRRVVGERAGALTALDEAEPTLPRYRVVRRIGEGGMGVVYEAEQKSPHRTVALKMIRPGAASERTLRRFEVEAEILGRLDHPGIARIFEAGTYDTGHGPQHFFAMELVRGEPLSEHVEARGPDVRERLELFAEICDAVHHAHQKGVIHRDLKPANILVTDEGRPKVLDFGVARVTGDEAGKTTLETLAGQLVGTLPFMSPEQVSGDADAIDVRADVYALGVILYQLLAGRLPHDLTGTPVSAAVRIVEEREPALLGSIRRELRGDLETIAATALDKDRERRYPSAASLAADVRRHLRYEPIAAHPPSGVYQLRKFARRNRVLVAGVGAVIVVLVAGILATWKQSVRARDAEGEAWFAANEALAAQLAAEDEARKAGAAAGFLQAILEQADPGQTIGEPTIRDVLEQAAERVGHDLHDEPEVQAAVLVSLGRAYLGLGDIAAARENLERALELREEVLDPDDLEIAHVLDSLCRLAIQDGDFVAVEGYVERIRRIRTELDPKEALGLGLALNALGMSYYGQGRFEEAGPLIRRAIELWLENGGDAPDLGVMTSNLGMVHLALEDMEDAERCFREGMAILEENLGARNPYTADAQNKLGVMLARKGELEEAEELVRGALVVRRDRLGDDHPSTATSLGDLGEIRAAAGDADGAEELMREAHDIFVRALGDDHPVTAMNRIELAQLLVARGELAEAEEHFLAVLDAYAERTDREVPSVIDAYFGLAGLCARTDRDEEAERHYDDALAVATRALPSGHGTLDRIRKARAAFFAGRD